jgi:hypothetical protein
VTAGRREALRHEIDELRPLAAGPGASNTSPRARPSISSRWAGSWRRSWSSAGW